MAANTAAIGVNDNTIGSVIEELKLALDADMKGEGVEDKTRALHNDMYLQALIQLQAIDRVLFKRTCKEIAKIVKVSVSDIIGFVNDDDDEEPTPLEVIIANKILDTNTLRTVKETKTILRLEDGGWEEISELEIAVMAQKIGGRENVSNNIIKEVIGTIQRENLISMEDFERRPELFMDANGKVFNSLTRQLEDVSSQRDVVIIHRIGAEFDPTATVPDEFLRALECIIPNKEERLSLQEHAGSGFYRKIKYDKALTIVGDTRNGKTTLMDIIEAVAGEKNVSHTPLQDMAKRFRMYDLWRKLFNFADDLSKESMKDTSNFKSQHGGARTSIEKKYVQSFDAHIYAKSVYGCNILPPAPAKDDDGYYSKFLLVSAPHTFLLPNEIGSDGLQAGEFNADPDLVEKITKDPKKLSGILNWCLEGLARLEKQKGYTLSITLEEGKARYDAMAEAREDLSRFIGLICDKTNPYSEIRKADLFELYKRYCKARKIPPASTNNFNKRLKNSGYNPKFRINNYTTPPQVDKNDLTVKNPYVMRGLSLKKNWVEVMKILESEGRNGYGEADS